MYYKIQKKSQNIPNPVTVKNWEYWMDLINGNPFTFMDRMFEFSYSNTIEEKVIFNQVNRLRSYGYAREALRKNGQSEDRTPKFEWGWLSSSGQILDFQEPSLTDREQNKTLAIREGMIPSPVLKIIYILSFNYFDTLSRYENDRVYKRYTL